MLDTQCSTFQQLCHFHLHFQNNFHFFSINFFGLSYNLLICTFIFTLNFRTMFTVFQKLLKLYSFSLSLSEHPLLRRFSFPLLRHFHYYFHYFINYFKLSLSLSFSLSLTFSFSLSEHPLLRGFSFPLLRQPLQALLLFFCQPF